MDDSVSIQRVFLGGKVGSPDVGVFKVSPHGIGWRSSSSSGHKIAIEEREMKRASWVRMNEQFQLRLEISGGTIYKFDGFQKSHKDSVTHVLHKKLGLTVKSEELSTKGWNWGELQMEKDQLVFSVDNKPLFDIPISDISHCSNSRNDVGIRFNQYDNISAKDNDLLVEMHFAVPPTNAKLAEIGNDTPAVNLKKAISSKTNVDDATAQGICLLEKLACIAPRGRFDVELTHRFMRMQGGTNQFLIQFANITRLFCLPRPDNRHYDVVVSVNPPLRQGLSPYPHIVFHFEATDSIDVTMNMTPEDLAEKFDGKIQKEMSHFKHQVLCKLLKHLTHITVTVPGSFKNSHGDSSVRCYMKAEAGLLYPLERGLIFLHKPATYIGYKEIDEIIFDRAEVSDVNTRSFDLTVKLTSGHTHKFQTLQKAEYSKMFSFLTGKGLRIGGTGQSAAVVNVGFAGRGGSSDEDHDDDDDESDDSSFGEGDGDDEDAPEEFESEVSSDEDFDEHGGDDSDNDKPPKKKEKEKETKKDKPKEKKKEEEAPKKKKRKSGDPAEKEPPSKKKKA